jgi:hypothetical protein
VSRLAQLGHSDPRLTLSIYAQVVQRQGTDQALIWRLMRCAAEPEGVPFRVRLAQRMAQRAPFGSMAPQANPVLTPRNRPEQAGYATPGEVAEWLKALAC